MKNPRSAPTDEATRLAVLEGYAVMDTLPEQALHDLTELAAQICDTPIALISLVDEHRQWFLSRVGFEIEETPRNVSFCAHAIAQAEIFIVPDATKDERFRDNPMVTGAEGIRFYAGAPLIAPSGEVMGALCVKDRVPRELTPRQQRALQALARQVMTHLELRRQTRELRSAEQRMRAFMDHNPAAAWTVDDKGVFHYVNASFCQIFGMSEKEFVGRSINELFEPSFAAEYLAGNRAVLEGRRVLETVDPGRRADGTIGHFLTVKYPIVEGQLLGGMAIDVTERERMETALRVSQSRFAAVFRANPAAIGITVLATGQVLDLNERMSEFFGWTPDEVIGKSVMDLRIWFNPDDRVRLIKQITETGSVRDAEVKMRKRNGEVRDVIISLERVELPGESEPIMMTMFIDVTERKQVEETLRRHQRILEETGRLAKIGGWEFDSATGRGTWTAEVARIHELDPSIEVTSEIGLSFYEEKSRPYIEAAVKAAVERGQPYDLELELRTAKGNRRWVRTICHPEMENGRVKNVSGSLQDITERREAEAQLHLLETSVARLNDMVMITEAEPQNEPGPRILFVNDAFVRRTGYSREEVLGRSPRFLQGPKTSRAELDRIRAAMKRWQPVRAELINYTKDGAELWLEIDIVPVADSTGWFTHWVAVERDITERKRSEARFRRLVDSNAQGVAFWNNRGTFTDANDAFLRLVGYSREDLRNQRINAFAITPPEYDDVDRRASRELAADGVSKPYEKEYLRKDGSRVHVLIGAAVFEDTPEEGVCFVVDLTELKKLEQQFLRGQRLESIGTLAGGIAHDLNNVLGPIIMSLDLLQARFRDKDSQELLEVIGSSARHGSQLVRQVLGFARGMEGQRVEISVKRLVEEVEKIVRETFPKNIQSRIALAEGLRHVAGDPTQLNQLLLNLCVNARDAMPFGGVLTISAENVQFDAQYAGLNPEAQPGAYISLLIEDTGTGIPPEVLDKIFDPFFTTKELGKGTGLGLSTSLGIVKSHGGFIRVHTEGEKGTRFTVYLPAQMEPGESSVPLAPTELPRGHGETILVVDDEAAMRHITKQTLETHGYRVLLACDGAEAVASFAINGAEIAGVLTDMAMPVMDGLSTIQALRRMRPDLPIIAASGRSTEEQMARLETLGVKHLLPKPFTAATLLTALAQVLRR